MAGLSGVRAVVFAYVAHVLAVAAAVLVLVWCIHFLGGLAFNSTNKSLIFNLHPVFMVIGFIIVGSEAIMSYRALPLRKESKKLIHLILQAIAIALGAVGIYAVFKFHNESGITNLYSLHSWIGLGTICLYGIQWILGFIIFFFPGAPPYFKQVALPWHVSFGLFVYTLAIGAAELGLLEKLTFLEDSGLAMFGSEALLVNFTALVILFLGASVVMSTIAPHGEEEPREYIAIAVSED